MNNKLQPIRNEDGSLYDKKAIVEEKITPMVEDMVDICRENGIQFFLTFLTKTYGEKDEDTMDQRLGWGNVEQYGYIDFLLKLGTCSIEDLEKCMEACEDIFSNGK